MPRETIKDLRAEVEKRDQEIGRLNHLLADMRARSESTNQALRLIKTLVEDAQGHGGTP
jgi:predicted  nucleic acid-binding Zn-ribbon protein